jgi:hypothetical protein
LALTFVGRLLYLSGTTRSALPFSFIIWHFFQNILFLFSPTRKKSLNRREKLSRKCIKEIFREWNFCCVSFFCLNVWKLVGRFLFYFKKNFLMFLRKKKNDSFMFARLKAVCAKRAFYSTSTLLADEKKMLKLDLTFFSIFFGAF